MALPALFQSRMIWCEDIGVGYYPVNPADQPYDAAYFERYAGMAQTDMGRSITASRLNLVNRYWSGNVVDVGIGSGAFVTARRHTWGFDVNPAAVAWLHERDLFWSPYTDPCQAITLWDVLEHIEDFPALLANVSHYVFAAIPLFTDAASVLRSRHFRRDEHYWYFSARGLFRVMGDLGWDLIEYNDDEIALGREAIGCFAFARRGSR